MHHTVEEITLPSGVTGLLIDVPGSAVLDTKIYFRAGFQFGTFDKYEIPHLIEHHVLNATRAYPRNGQIWAEIIKNGGYFNAATDSRFITYISKCTADDGVRTISLIGEILNNSLFPSENFTTERENVRSELSRNVTNYGAMAANLLDEQAHPHLSLSYATRISQLDSITHDDVTSYYNATHSRTNAGFIVAGAVDINKAALTAALDNALSPLPEGKRNTFTEKTGLRVEWPIVRMRDIDPVYFNLSWFGDGGSMANRAALRIANTILSKGFGSRLLGQARDRGLTYDLVTSSAQNRFEGSETVRGFAEPKNMLPLLELIAGEFYHLATSLVSQSELENAKNMVKGSITIGAQTASAIASWYANDYLVYGHVGSYEDYFAATRAVTPDELKAQFARMVESKKHGASFIGKVDDAAALQYSDRLASVWK